MIARKCRWAVTLAVLAASWSTPTLAKVDSPPDELILWNANAFTAHAIVAATLALFVGWVGGALLARGPKLGTWLRLAGGMAFVGLAFTASRIEATVQGGYWGTWALASAARVIAFGALGGAAAGIGRGRSWRWWLAEVLAAVTLLAVAMLAGIGLGSAEWGMARLGRTLLLAALAVGLVGAIVSRDRSTGHLRALVVAVGLGMLAMVATGLGLRFIGPSPEAVVSLPRLLFHPWIAVSDSRDFPVSRRTETLVNVETGAWLMLGPMRFDGCFIDGPVMARGGDGEVIAWASLRDGPGGRRVFLRRLLPEIGPARPLRCVPGGIDGYVFILSPTSRMLAVSRGPTILLIDVESDRVVQEWEAVHRVGMRLYSLEDDGRLTFIVSQKDSGCVELHEALSDAQDFRLIATIEPPTDRAVRGGVPLSLPGNRIAVAWRVGPGRTSVVSVHDARDGRVLGLLPDQAAPAYGGGMEVLADGRWLRAIKVGDDLAVEALTPSGESLGQLDVAKKFAHVQFAGELRPGVVVVGVSGTDEADRVILVDLDRWAVVDSEEGLKLVDRAFPDVTFGAGASRVFQESQSNALGSLVELDWTTHRRRVLVAGKKDRPAAGT